MAPQGPAPCHTPRGRAAGPRSRLLLRDPGVPGVFLTAPAGHRQARVARRMQQCRRRAELSPVQGAARATHCLGSAQLCWHPARGVRTGQGPVPAVGGPAFSSGSWGDPGSCSPRRESRGAGAQAGVGWGEQCSMQGWGDIAAGFRLNPAAGCFRESARAVQGAQAPALGRVQPQRVAQPVCRQAVRSGCHGAGNRAAGCVMRGGKEAQQTRSG